MKQHRGILAWLIDEDTRKSTEQLAETVGFTDPARPVKPPNHPSGLESWSLGAHERDALDLVLLLNEVYLNSLKLTWINASAA